jgi:hypothetical protein
MSDNTSTHRLQSLPPSILFNIVRYLHPRFALAVISRLSKHFRSFMDMNKEPFFRSLILQLDVNEAFRSSLNPNSMPCVHGMSLCFLRFSHFHSDVVTFVGDVPIELSPCSRHQHTQSFHHIRLSPPRSLTLPMRNLEFSFNDTVVVFTVPSFDEGRCMMPTPTHEMTTVRNKPGILVTVEYPIPLQVLFQFQLEHYPSAAIFAT